MTTLENLKKHRTFQTFDGEAMNSIPMAIIWRGKEVGRGEAEIWMPVYREYADAKGFMQAEMMSPGGAKGWFRMSAPACNHRQSVAVMRDGKLALLFSFTRIGSVGDEVDFSQRGDIVGPLTPLDELILAADLESELDRMMLSDAFEEAGFESTAKLLRTCENAGDYWRWGKLSANGACHGSFVFPIGKNAKIQRNVGTFENPIWESIGANPSFPIVGTP